MTASRAGYDRLARLFSAVVAACLLVVLALPMALIALAVGLRIGRPVLFRQPRPGLNGRAFTILKFRTMIDRPGPDGLPLPDAQRLTRFGTLLRRSSLDELPELVNVLRGDMNLVGPRPLLVEYLPLYDGQQARRHEVRPGITGWAQINGRNAIDWDRKLALDVWYVDNRSFALDLRILALTVLKVIAREGISSPGSATTDRFRGSEAGRGGEDET